MKLLHNRFVFQIFFYIQFILFSSGCKIIDWGKKNFKQAHRYETNLTVKMDPFFRSTIVYQQLSTIANFDALFLTDKAQMLFVDYYKSRHLVSDEKESIMRQRLLNENKYYISFYVVGSQAENLYVSSHALFTGEYHKQQALLGEKEAEWQVYMKVNGKKFPPASIRSVEMPIEYQHFFGSRYSQFKSVYLVKFDAVDEHDKPILSDCCSDVALFFTSPRYQAELHWKDIAYLQ